MRTMNLPNLGQQRRSMYRLIQFIWVALILMLDCHSHAQYYSNACRSINGKLGTCVELPTCPLFSGWLKQRPLVKQNLRLIVQYTCHFDKENPKVCCPNENLFVQDSYFQIRVSTPNRREITSLNTRLSGGSSILNKPVFPTTSISFPSSEEIENKTRNVHSLDPFLGDRGEFPKKQFIPLLFPEDSKVKTHYPYDVVVKPDRNSLKHNERIPKRDLRYHPNFRLMPKMHECSNAVKLDSLLGTYGGYPWIGLIGKKKRRSLDFDHECAGTVINNRYLITTAHCFHRPYTRYVRLGEYDLDTLIDQGSEFLPQSRREDYRIEKLTIHPDYDAARGANDIALVRVDRQLALNTTFIRPACLPFLSEYGIENRLDMNNLDGKAFWVAGWSRHSWEGYSSGLRISVLQDGIVESTSHDMCRKDYPYLPAYNSKLQICVGGKGKRNSCVPDSGGPAMLSLKVPSRVTGFSEPKYFMMGLLSRGPTGRICQEGRELPTSVYTKISKYLSWILDNIKD